MIYVTPVKFLLILLKQTYNMKKIIYFSFLIVLFISCKKQETAPAKPVETPQVQSTFYNVFVISRAKNFTGDTLRVKLNDNPVFTKIGSSVDNTWTLVAKTGDRLNVYYNPGTVLYNNSTIADENGLIISVLYNNIDGDVFEETCNRCKTNYNYTFK